MIIVHIIVLQETSEAMGIEINDMDTKGYEVLIYKKKENVWEETRENLFLLLYRFYIFKCRAGERVPCTNQFKLELRFEISMIIRINAQSKYLIDKLLPLWGGHEITLELAEKLREESTNDEETAVILNEAGKVTKIYTKKLRNHYQFPIVSEDALILKQSEEANFEKYSLKLFKNIPAKPRQ